MYCTDCSEPNQHGDYDPCCNHGDGTCEAAYTENTVSNCIHCGAEMHLDESDSWRHYSQMELPLNKRHLIHSMESKPKN